MRHNGLLGSLISNDNDLRRVETCSLVKISLKHGMRNVMEIDTLIVEKLQANPL